MALTKISSNEIQPAAITSDLISADVSLGVKISNVSIANSSYTILDDTAVDTAGGYIVITGAGFNSGAQVIIGGTNATSVTRVSSTELRAQVPAKSAATYNVYVVNTDGSTGIRVNGLTYSSLPTWVTGSTLDPQQVDVAFNLNFDATSAVSYANTSAIPAGTTLLANGYFYGTVTGITEETTYSFTVQATDAENQDSPRTFSVTVTVVVADEYFNSTVLLLNGDGTNGAQNQTFVDSSTNNFTVTRVGNSTQGSFSPFSPTGWSAYFDGTGDNLTFSTITFSSDFTAECWVFKTAVDASGYTNIFSDSSQATQLAIDLTTAGSVCAVIAGGVVIGASGTAVTSNQWHHIAWVRQGSTCRIYVDGVQQGTGTSSSSMAIDVIGSFGTGGYEMNGYISNVRLTNACLYPNGTTFTPSTVPLTTTVSSGTVQMLTCQSNRFKDNSTNNFAITRNGDTKVVPFSPFAPTEEYDLTTHGGSAYFDGTGDYLTIADNTALDVEGGNFTMEAWVYMNVNNGSAVNTIFAKGFGSAGGWMLWVQGAVRMRLYDTGGTQFNLTGSITPAAGQWHHIAVTRSGNTVALYVNGVADGTLSYTSTNNNSSVFEIGGYSAGTAVYAGYIASGRLVKGTAVYTSAFTPPTAPLTAISGTTLLLNFTNAGIYDATAKNIIETVGNAQVSTSVKKYGTGSIYIPAYTDTCKLPGVSLLGDFTIEGWFKPSISGDEKFFILQGINVTNGFILATSTTEIRWRSNGTTDISYTISDSNWYHVAIVRSGTSSNNLKMYYNGNQVTQGTYTNQILSSVGSLYVGIGNQLGSQFSSYGYIDDLRITNGVARYTSNFTPPTAALPVQ